MTAIIHEFSPSIHNENASAAPSSESFEQVPELPKPNQRWTIRRKAAVLDAVRGRWLPIEEACEVYNISVDEFIAWERDLDHFGIPGLRSTRYQIYRRR